MAQYKVKKFYIHDTCQKALTQLYEQKEILKKSKKWYHYFFKPFATKMEIDFFRSRDISFCIHHLTACASSHSEYAIMSEDELCSLNRLWVEFIYDLKN